MNNEVGSFQTRTNITFVLRVQLCMSFHKKEQYQKVVFHCCEMQRHSAIIVRNVAIRPIVNQESHDIFPLARGCPMKCCPPITRLGVNELTAVDESPNSL
jgi:hypothetical protein